MEEVTPRIRDLIEKQLLGESEDELGESSDDDEDGELMTDVSPSPVESSPPVDAPMFGEFDVNDDSNVENEACDSYNEMSDKLESLSRNLAKMSNASSIVSKTAAFKQQISEMITTVEDMYESVQRGVTDSDKKKLFESKLENCFMNLKKLQENKMSSNRRNRITEEDLTLKITGLPDGLDLDNPEVADLISVELETRGGEEGGDESEASAGDENAEASGDEGGDLDLGDLDLGGDEGAEASGDEGEKSDEGDDLDDDEVVEVDESVLRKEILRMKKMRESKSCKPSDKDVAKSFGDGCEEGDPLDVEIRTESVEDEEVVEADEGDPGGTLRMVGETDDSMTQLGNRRKKDEQGDKVADTHDSMSEMYNRRISFEKRLQERSRSRMNSIIAEIKSTKDQKKISALRTKLRETFTIVRESEGRVKKFMSVLSEVKGRNDSRPNGASKSLAESNAIKVLRDKLTESNLNNTKLVYANKVLQTESLSKQQKAKVIQKLDEAKSVAEVKSVYDSLLEAVNSSSKKMNEGAERTVLSSSSRVTKPTSATLSEGVETDRWAMLAGLKKLSYRGEQ